MHCFVIGLGMRGSTIAPWVDISNSSVEQCAYLIYTSMYIVCIKGKVIGLMVTYMYTCMYHNETVKKNKIHSCGISTIVILWWPLASLLGIFMPTVDNIHTCNWSTDIHYTVIPCYFTGMGSIYMAFRLPKIRWFFAIIISGLYVAAQATLIKFVFCNNLQLHRELRFAF